MLRAAPQSRYGAGRARGAGGGEIVEVQGGRIVRSTGRKDRHSKVCTAKGTRDRRVRLSAHTAIQFYDVQDRLGYDRPSKAVDWLIKNAKAAIDELAELPAWTPTAAAAATSSRPPEPPANQLPTATAELPIGESSKKPALAEPAASSAAFSFGGDEAGGAGSASISFPPPSLNSDAIADTIKSFFPMAAAATSPSNPTIGFQSYPPDLLSRTNSHTQDLRLSLQSFQDPTFNNPQSSHHHHGGGGHHNPVPSAHSVLYSTPAHLAFDSASASWDEQSQRMVAWNVADTTAVAAASGGVSVGGGGYMFSVPPQQAVPLHSALGQSLLFSQRGPLQSSTTPSFRAWADSGLASAVHQMSPTATLLPSMSSIGFASGAGFSGFRIPARIQGEEEHDGITDQPPSASSASHH